MNDPIERCAAEKEVYRRAGALLERNPEQMFAYLITLVQFFLEIKYKLQK